MTINLLKSKSKQFYFIFVLLKKEFALDNKKKQNWSVALLYLFGSIFTIYLLVGQNKNNLSIPLWNSILWVILFFSAMQILANTFSKEPKNRDFYYSQITNAESIIFAKLIYNFIQVSILFVAGYFIFAFMLGNQVQNLPLFILSLVLGSASYVSTLTLVSAIAYKANSNNGIMAILGLPIVLPTTLEISQLSKNAIDGLDISVSYDEISIICSLIAISISLAFLLFPFLWKD